LERIGREWPADQAGPVRSLQLANRVLRQHPNRWQTGLSMESFPVVHRGKTRQNVALAAFLRTRAPISNVAAESRIVFYPGFVFVIAKRIPDSQSPNRDSERWQTSGERFQHEL
jgi:hypothetical protein